MERAIVTNIQGYSIHDGPGIRTVVFIKGCPLRCRWCANPENLVSHIQTGFIQKLCQNCGRCINACPNGAIVPGDGQYRIQRERCISCGKCVESCYYDALVTYGKEKTSEEVFRAVRKDKMFYDQSGGGVTVSGGEALSQAEFTLALLKRFKAEGLHTALDTTGFAQWEKIEAVLPYVDLFLYDLKHMDSEKHRKMVAVPNEPILENALKIAEAGGKFQIRIPVIPMFNEDEENIRATAEFCCRLKDAVEVIQLLPYHNMGVSKYQRISDEPAVEAVPPSEEKMQKLRDIMASYGLNVVIH